ncbi:MAG: Nif3-like dinuclear metal center hexameric protein [Bacteroidales bacterium]|nr:Nif3-like dinuclear metal center hexameric protein [Bacteroidales bacterium]
MRIRDIIDFLEAYAPVALQESYDNSGLLVGDQNQDLQGALICLDVTDKIIEEARSKKCNLIISHHPLIFKGLKQLTGSNYIERIVIKAIKNDIAIYASHTNLDKVKNGVSGMIAQKLGLKDPQILSEQKDMLRKLVTFCPIEKADMVRDSIFKAGAGHIGNYDDCSFSSIGTGTFRANEQANPYIGEVNKLHFENETRIETIYPIFKEKQILKALFESHPYEEVAYDIYPLNNSMDSIGLGIIGELEKAVSEKDFLLYIKNHMKTKCVRHTPFRSRPIKKVAVCGGSGSFMTKTAINAGADILITGDIKYHEFFDADGSILLADIGHYESEQFTKDLLHSILKEKFTNFAILKSEINTNPVQYL